MDITSQKFKSLKTKAQAAQEKIAVLGVDEVRNRDFDFQKTIHIPIIKKYLIDVENASRKKHKCTLATQLFSYIVTYKDWVDNVPKFKSVVKAKLEMFMNDETIPLDLFDPSVYYNLLFGKVETPSSLVEPLEEMNIKDVTDDPSLTISDVENECEVVSEKANVTAQKDSILVGGNGMAYDYEPVPNFASKEEQEKAVIEGEIAGKNIPVNTLDHLNIDLEKKIFHIHIDENKKCEAEKYFQEKNINMEQTEGWMKVVCSILDIISLEKEKPDWFLETKME